MTGTLRDFQVKEGSGEARDKDGAYYLFPCPFWKEKMGLENPANQERRWVEI